MHVAIIHNHPIHYKHLLFQALKKAGLDFEVIFVASQSVARYESIEFSEHSYQHRFCFVGHYEHAPASTRSAETWKALNEGKPDLLVISGCHAAECWSAWLWALWESIPVVLWYECNSFDYSHRPLWKEKLKQLFLSNCRRVHVYGRSNQEYLERLGFPSNRIDSRRAVVDVNRFSLVSARGYSAGSVRRALFVGRLAEEKNIGLLLRAVAKANARSEKGLWKLTIAGTGPQEAQLRLLARELGLEPVVEFRGYVAQAQLPDLYREADLFILPSNREPWGLVTLEAMLSRTPIAVSTHCGCAADLVNGSTGWTFASSDTDELASILLHVSQLPASKLAEMGSSCYALASGYSASAAAGRVIESLTNARVNAHSTVKKAQAAA